MSEDTATPPIVVTDNSAASRYEARLAGDDAPRRVAVASYERRDDAIVFTHTVVPAALQGHGIGAHLARAVLDDARRRGLAVVPLCPFVASYIRRHREYEELVPAELRDELLAKRPREQTDDRA